MPLRSTRPSPEDSTTEDDLGCGEGGAPVACPIGPVAGPGHWARVFASGPLTPLASVRLVSGDLVVAGVVDVGTVSLPDLPEVADLTKQQGDTEDLVALVRISAVTGEAVWVSTLRGTLGGGEIPRVALYAAKDGNNFVVGVMLGGATLDLAGTLGTQERVESDAGSVVLSRFEGDGRVRNSSLLESPGSEERSHPGVGLGWKAQVVATPRRGGRGPSLHDRCGWGRGLRLWDRRWRDRAAFAECGGCESGGRGPDGVQHSLPLSSYPE